MINDDLHDPDDPIELGTTGDTGTTDSSTTLETGTDPTTDATDSDTATSETTGTDTDTLTTDWETTYDTDTTPGCDKVDFLFVIDNYNGGLGGLAALKASIPDFVDKVNAHLDGYDVHFLVTDTDDEWGTPECEADCTNQGFCDPWPDYACNAPITACDATLGAGVVYPSGSDTPCDVVPGRRYVTDENANLVDALTCLTDVGSHGGGTQSQAGALTSAVLPFNTKPGGCNEDFLRSDALLVVILLTHTDDDTTPGLPSDWAQVLINIKGGNPHAIVLLGLLDDSANKPDNICQQPVFNPDPRLSELVAALPYGIEGSACTSDFGPYFDEAFSIVDVACQEFIPE
ncbi:MAG: hypothetical protein KC636_21270 [Myxococcales bacterium]|nr:hypothetical protein [Myxococcales bacterium]